MKAFRTVIKAICMLQLVMLVAAVGFVLPHPTAVLQTHAPAVLAQPDVGAPSADHPVAVSDAPPVAAPHFAPGQRKWDGACPHVPFTININTAQAGGADGSAADFRHAITTAAETWSNVPGAAFVLTDAGPTDAVAIGFNGTNEIMFMHQGTDQPAALARFWFTGDNTIVEADIWINDDYNWDTTGAPDADEIDLQSVLLHELGHWLALGHSEKEEAIMYATIPMGVLKRTLDQDDIDGIRSIYPAAAATDCAATPAATRSQAVQSAP